MKGPLQADVSWWQDGTNAHAQLTCPAGVTALIGPSGAGKTSLARILAGLNHPAGGRVILEPETLVDTDRRIFVPPENRRVGYLPQGASLFPHMTVRQNILFGCRSKWTPSLSDLAERLGLSEHLDAKPKSLSGGEARRAALARALAAGPECLILDEPFTGLDPKTAQQVRREILRLAEAGVPILLITHGLDLILATAHQTYIMDHGAIRDYGPTGKVLDGTVARSLFGEAYGGVLLPVSQRQDGLFVGPHRVSCTAATGTDDPILLQIRSRDVALARSATQALSILNQWPVTVTALDGIGPETLVGLLLNDTHYRLQSLVTEQSADSLSLKVGDTLTALVKASATQAIPLRGDTD